MNGSLLLTPAEFADELRISRRQAYELLKTPAFAEVVVHVPALRGVRISRAALERAIQRLNPTSEDRAR